MSEEHLSKERKHHEAMKDMKKSGFHLFGNHYEMRISRRFSRRPEPALLHGFMVISLCRQVLFT